MQIHMVSTQAECVPVYTGIVNGYPQYVPGPVVHEITFQGDQEAIELVQFFVDCLNGKGSRKDQAALTDQADESRA